MASGKTKYGVSEQAPMGWSELRDGLADHLSAGAIHLNKRFSQLQQHDDHVQLLFTDGTSAEAKIVVGADGCFSKIRQQTLGDGLPDFTVSCLNHIQLLLHTVAFASLPNQTTTIDCLYSDWELFHMQQDARTWQTAWLMCSPNLILQGPMLRACCGKPFCTHAV